jgi:hypothetical protein
MKSIFNFIFSKKTQSTSHNPSISMANQLQLNQGNIEPRYNIFTEAPIQDSYQVDEISFDEFKNSARIERRKFPRKPGETRSAYSTKQ